MKQAMKVSLELLGALTQLRAEHDNPSLEAIGAGSGCSKSTVQSALNGKTVSWITLSGILKYFKVEDPQVIASYRRMWVNSKLAQAPMFGPDWAQQLHDKFDTLNAKVDKMIAMFNGYDVPQCTVCQQGEKNDCEHFVAK